MILKIRKRKKSSILFFNVFFFGVGIKGIDILENKFPKEYFVFINFKDRKAKYSSNEHYYSGHVRRLGHYFRNIYQAIKYVDEQPFLSPDKKYEYITIFRAQMSVYEQAIFFYNSLSKIGDIWEVKRYKQYLPEKNRDKKNLLTKLWITKYDLIRNTLNNDGYVSKKASIKWFYPLLNLEGGHDVVISSKLPFKGNLKYICRICFDEKIGYTRKTRLYDDIKDAYEVYGDWAFENFKCNEKGCKIKTILKTERRN